MPPGRSRVAHYIPGRSEVEGCLRYGRGTALSSLRKKSVTFSPGERVGAEGERTRSSLPSDRTLYSR